MSHCAIRICSSSSQAVCEPSICLLIFSIGKSRSTASSDTCADSPLRSCSRWSRRASSLSISEEYQMARLRLFEFSQKSFPPNFFCAEGADVRRHDLCIEPCRAAFAKMIDQEEQRELRCVRGRVKHTLAAEDSTSVDAV